MRKDFDKEHFDGLFRRYVAGQCSPEETEQLLRLFEVSDKAALLDCVEAAMGTEEQGIPTRQEQETMSALFAGVQDRIAARRRQNRVYPLLKWSAAAAVVLAVGAGSLRLWRRHELAGNKEGQPALAAKQQEKIVPGHAGATLRLAGGNTVLLDSMADGAQIAEGKVQITKRNGQLVYAGTADQLASNTITTARGQEWQLVLPDGTKVWLNAATTLTYPVSFEKQSSRTVALQGEAYFEVKDDKNKPFLVHTAGQDVKVLGTFFNISAYGDDPQFRTTLLEGAVQVNGDQVLRPGQQAATGREGKTVVRNTDAAAAIAWKNGSFDFNDDNIRDILRKVSRWYNVDVVYRGVIPEDKLEGSISRWDDVSRLIGVIQKTGLVKITVSGKTLYVDGN